MEKTYAPVKPKGKLAVKPVRMYSKLWEKIKADHPKEVFIACPPELRKRIAKAVRQEKFLDESWGKSPYFRVFAEETPEGLKFYLKPWRTREIARRIL